VSNVLIGIIGVILFIALAMAGAMFLGPQFQRAFVNSKAMTLSQMASQINMALSMSAPTPAYRSWPGLPSWASNRPGI
jgi:hypothetical protein